MTTNETNEANIYSQGEKILEDLFVKKYDEASDPNWTNKAPQKKAWHENNSNKRKKGGCWLGCYWNQERIKYNNYIT